MTPKLVISYLLLALAAAGQTLDPCDLNGDAETNVADVQLAVNQALGLIACGSADLSQDGECNIVDVQRFINASLGGECLFDPPAGGYVTYQPTVNPNQMVWNGLTQRREIVVETDGTVWWRGDRGEADVYSVPLFPGDTAEIAGVFAANVDGSPLTPTQWAFTFGMVIVMESQNEHNWEMAAVGNRPVSQPIHVTVEYKRTVGDVSRQDDIGGIGQAYADIRVSVQTDGTLYWEYRPQGGVYTSLLTTAMEDAPQISCTAGCNVMIGAYAYLTTGLPFMGGASGVTVQ